MLPINKVKLCKVWLAGLLISKVYSHRLSVTLQLAQWLNQSSSPPSNVRLLNTEAGGIGDGRDLPFRSPPKYISCGGKILKIKIHLPGLTGKPCSQLLKEHLPLQYFFRGQVIPGENKNHHYCH